MWYDAGYRPLHLTERWLSGRKQRFAKPSYGLKPVPGVRIPPSPPEFPNFFIFNPLRPREPPGLPVPSAAQRILFGKERLTKRVRYFVCPRVALIAGDRRKEQRKELQKLIKDALDATRRRSEVQ